MPTQAAQPGDRLRRREIPELPQPNRLQSIPAWLLSLGLHVCLIVTASLIWVAKPKGTGGAPDRPVGIAVVYESGGDESYFLDEAGTAQIGASDSAARSETIANSLPTTTDSVPSSETLLSDLLPGSGAAGGELASAAGGLGLGDGGATLGSGRDVPKLKTTVFGIEGEGTRFLYVFDRSESMLGYGGAPLRSAKAEMLSSIKSLGEVHQFQIIFYNDSPLPFGGMGSQGPKLFKGDQASKDAAARFIRDVPAAGGTRHIDALRMALAMGPDVVFFLTDADSSPPAREIDDLQTRAIRGGTTIHSIQFGSGAAAAGSNWLKRLADGLGGQYRYIDVTSL